MRLAALAVLAALVASGCSGGSTGATDLSELGFDDIVASGTVGIAGLVIDAAIRPIEGAAVALVGHDRRTTTDAEGRFAFGDLEPGEYILNITAPGYHAAEVAATARGSLARAELIRVQLDLNRAVSPYHDIYHYSGYLECSTSSLALCAAVEIVPEVLRDNGVPQDNFTNDEFIVRFRLDRPPDFLQGEAVWDSSQSVSDALWLIVDSSPVNATHYEDDAYAGRADAAGPSPLVAPYSEERLPHLKDPGIENVTVRLFSSGWDPLFTVICVVNDCDDDQPVGLPGVTVQQPYEVFVTATYNFRPAPGWSFVADGAPRPPG